MPRTAIRLAILALAALVAPLTGTAHAQDDAVPPSAPAPAVETAGDEPSDEPSEVARSAARRYLEAIDWMEAARREMKTQFDLQENLGQVPTGFGNTFLKHFDRERALEAAVDAFARHVDPEVLDALSATFESDLGRRFVEQSVAATEALTQSLMDMGMEEGMETMRRIMDGKGEPGDDPEKGPSALDRMLDKVGGNLREAKSSSNETAAIAMLHNLTICQAQIQMSGRIDCDQDGIGEYAGFLELTGTVGVRKAFNSEIGTSSFAKQGSPVRPPLLQPSTFELGKDGIAERAGYYFRIYLPDGSTPAGFTREVGGTSPVLVGGTGSVAVDLSETTWCAYAWPQIHGETGNRAFFVNQSGDVMQSENGVTKWQGRDHAPPGNSAFTGAGITSRLAVGTAGNDGAVWKVTN